MYAEETFRVHKSVNRLRTESLGKNSEINAKVLYVFSKWFRYTGKLFWCSFLQPWKEKTNEIFLSFPFSQFFSSRSKLVLLALSVLTSFLI